MTSFTRAEIERYWRQRIEADVPFEASKIRFAQRFSDLRFFVSYENICDRAMLDNVPIGWIALAEELIEFVMSIRHFIECDLTLIEVKDGRFYFKYASERYSTIEADMLLHLHAQSRDRCMLTGKPSTSFLANSDPHMPLSNEAEDIKAKLTDEEFSRLLYPHAQH